MKKSIFLFFAAILYATSALGIGAKQCYVYFDNSTWNATNVKFVFWQDKGSNKFYIDTESMTTLSNTQLKYVRTTDHSSWNPAIAAFNFLEVANTSDWGDQELTWSNFQSWAQTKYTAKQSDWDFNGGYQLFTGAQTEKNKSVSGTYNSGYANLLQKTHTLKVMVSTDGGATYEQATTSPATVTCQTYTLKTATATSSTKYTIAKDATTTSNASVKAIYTAKTTLKAENIADGYTFVGWYDATNGTMISTSATPSAWYPKEAITLEARFSKEEAYPVTISYMCGSEEIESPATITVGVSTASAITAPVIAGYNFSNWTLGSGVQSADATANPISITTKASGDYTLTANYSELPKETVYFINTNEWTGTINAYAWTDGTPKVENAGWAGLAATKEDFQIGGYDVYSYTATAGTYANVIFNGSGGQTADLTWQAGKYYALSKEKWYDDAAAAEAALAIPIPDETVYLINTGNWSKVMIHTWNGVGGTAWPGVEMTPTGETIEGYAVYSYTAKQGGQANLLFQESENVNKTSDLTWQAGKYYAPLKNEWYDTKEDAAEALATPLADETVYFVNNKKWANVAIYGWNGTLTDGTGANNWPGAAMTKTAEQVAGFDVYSYTVKEGTLKNILFNHNGDENKTSDFVWTNGKYYYMDAGAQKDKNYAGGTKEEVAEIVAVPVVDNYYVSGTFNGWASSDAAKLTLNGQLYTKELTLEAGAHMFKVQKNNWAGEWGYSNIKGAYVGMEEGTNDDGDKNNNIKLTLSTKTTFTVKFNLADNEITFDGLTEDETETLVYTVEVPEGTEKCFIAGKMNNWEFALMTQKDATHWTITYDNVLKDMEYKYACQASWDYVEKDKDGNDLADNRTWKENDKVEKWGKPIVVTYQLKGVGGWDQPGIELVQNPDPEKASEYMLTCQAISATDAIKVVRLENGEIKDYYGNGTVKDGVEVAVNYDGDGNITLPAGKYNFYFDTNESEKKLWIAAATDCGTEPTPDYTRTTTAGKFGTICLPFGSTNYTGMELYEFVGKEEGKAYLGSVETLEAGVPYIFLATGTELAVYSDGTTAATPDENNGLVGTFTNGTEVTVGNYILFNNAICEVTATCWVNANRAYIVWKDIPAGAPQQMPGRRYVSMGTQGTNATTGVDNLVVPEGQVLKVIENGQLIIIRGGEKFNVQGQKL